MLFFKPMPRPSRLGCAREQGVKEFKMREITLPELSPFVTPLVMSLTEMRL